MESLYLDHKKEMHIYRFAENERSVKTLKSLAKIDKDTDIVDGKIQFEQIETHIFDDLSAFDLNDEVKFVIKGKLELIKKNLQIELAKSKEEAKRLRA